ncbi:MAG TPA: BrnT family toxin [Gammaproteobacteria bacterium]|nr:BrnT family toxin [Gammaproteobacteria bacterium]
MEVEWDPKKSQGQREETRVSLHAVATVFGGPMAVTFDDPDHSIDEAGLIAFSAPRFKCLLVVGTLGEANGFASSVHV